MLFCFFDGFRNSSIPQYIDKGSAIIPDQVIKVPKGIELALSTALVNSEEPVKSRKMELMVITKKLKKNTFLLLIFIIATD